MKILDRRWVVRGVTGIALLAGWLFASELAAQPAAEEANAGDAPAETAEETERPLVNPFVVNPQRQEGSYFINPEDPEANIPTGDERFADQLQFAYLLMELADKADTAFAAKDYEQAAKFYRAMAKAVPERSVAWSKLCQIQQLLGNLREAEAACEEAIRTEGTTVADHARFVEVFLANRPEVLLPADLERVDVILAHIGTRNEAELITARLTCRLGARLEDAERLRKCTKVLNEKLPHDPLTVSYSWALAIAENDSRAAARELARAEAIGLPSAALENMRQSGERLLARGWSRTTRIGVWVIALAVASGLVVYLVRRRRKELAHA